MNREGRPFSANKLREKVYTRFLRKLGIPRAAFIPDTVPLVPCSQTAQPRL